MIGIDVSIFNEPVDWQAVKPASVDDDNRTRAGVALRAARGSTASAAFDRAKQAASASERPLSGEGISARARGGLKSQRGA